MFKLRIVLILLSLLYLIPINLTGQNGKSTVSGYISDASTGEKLIGANVYDPKSGSGTSTNTYGFYSLTLPEDSLVLAVSYIGYETQYYRILLNKDQTLNIDLGADIEMEAVEVVAEDLDKIEERTQMSQISIPIQQIKQLPALLGEVDVLKALQLLPGVQSGGEGTSGMYVRGGSPDQNLILLDGVPVYNVSHLFGFFSVFNADAIKDVKLTKGGFPARYGGRLSSVLEINMKEGNMNEFHGEGSIGIISSKLTLEGPIWKDKTSFIVSARRTYIDALAQPVIAASGDGNSNGGYYFYDVNAKVNHKFSDKDRLYLSLYTGEDKFYFSNKSTASFDGETQEQTLKGGLDWGNVTSALRWNHLLNNKLFSNTTLTYSRYLFDITTEFGSKLTPLNGASVEQSFSAKYISGIEDLGLKVDFDYMPNPSNYIKFGAGVTHHTFKPGAVNTKLESTDLPPINVKFGDLTKAIEFATYIENEIRVGEKFNANLGLHYSGFAVNDAFYNALQPRIGLRYLLPKNMAVKASFATMTQYIHLLTNEGIGLPTDLWVPTTNNVIPEQSWQAALGFAHTFAKQYEVSIEGYYKKMKNLVSYKEGASFLGTTDWEDKVEQGQGDSYGVEVFIQKKKGKFTGWIGYTLSWTNRQFDNINFGRPYSFKYDRRHDLSLVGSYKFSEKFRLSATWVYGTGNAISLENSLFNAYYPGINQQGQIPNSQSAGFYEEKNNFRMAPYHRFDVGIEYVRKGKRGKWTHTWRIGAYNAYNRKNPFFIFPSIDDNGDKVLKQFSLFPIIPSVAYSFKF